MQKWMRNYKIKFERGFKKSGQYYPQEEIYVSYPFTLHLNIERGVYASANTGVFQIYNLSREVQARLWKDQTDQTRYITMWLYAGYGDVLPLIFVGDVQYCYSYKEGGSTEYVTEINACDGLYFMQYGYSNLTINGGIGLSPLLKTLIDENPFVKLGYVTPTIPKFQKSQTFIGQTMELLRREFANHDVFVDNGLLNVLAENEIIPTSLPIIYADSGLLGSPKRSGLYLEFQMLFEPALSIAQGVSIVSDSLQFINQTYRLIGLRHSGVISPVEPGSLITTGTCSLGEQNLEQVQGIATQEYGGSATQGTWVKPAQGKITSRFGQRSQPIKGASINHKGIDIGATYGSPVKAAANGKVISTGQGGGYGNYILMDNGIINGKRVSSLYGHLQSIGVQAQQVVGQNSVIGTVGSTGISTGPHLHFEIRENGAAVNPTKYIGSY